MRVAELSDVEASFSTQRLFHPLSWATWALSLRAGLMRVLRGRKGVPAPLDSGGNTGAGSSSATKRLRSQFVFVDRGFPTCKW